MLWLTELNGHIIRTGMSLGGSSAEMLSSLRSAPVAQDTRPSDPALPLEQECSLEERRMPGGSG